MGMLPAGAGAWASGIWKIEIFILLQEKRYLLKCFILRLTIRHSMKHFIFIVFYDLVLHDFE